MDLDIIWTQVDALLQPKKHEEPVLEFVCKSCNGNKVYGSDNMPVCSSCGLVDQYCIDESAEWTSGVSDEGKVSDPARCGNPNANPELFSEEWGKGTIIATKHTTYKNKRMSKINFHMSMNHKDRALFHAYKDIEDAGQTLPQNVLQTAKILYKKFNDEKLTRGNVRLGIKGNCLLYACRLAQIPRTTKEIADMFNIQPKDISRTAQIFKETIMGETEQNYVTKPINVLQRLLNAFEISREERYKCVKMCSSLEKCPELMSKTPNTIATAIIYINLAARFSKSEVASLCQVSIPTINKIEVIIKRYLEV